MRRASTRRLTGLNPTDVKVLYCLIKSNRPLTIKELADRTALSPPQLGRILNKLVKEGLVTYVTAGFLKSSPELASMINLKLDSIENMHGKTRLFIPKISLNDLKTVPEIEDWINYLETGEKY